jgi:hypothetical protein
VFDGRRAALKAIAAGGLALASGALAAAAPATAARLTTVCSGGASRRPVS